MVAYENELRMSEWAQRLYADPANSYEYVTNECIQKQVVRYYCAQNGAEKEEKEWMQLLKEAPHLLGPPAARISNYIAGSFAAFRDHILKIGEDLPKGLEAVDRQGKKRSWDTLLKERYTVVICGSAT